MIKSLHLVCKILYLKKGETKMKRMTALLAALIITCTAFAACGGDDSSSKGDSSKPSASQAADESSLEDAPSDESNSEASENNSDPSSTDPSSADESKTEDSSKADESSTAEYKNEIGELTKAFSENLRTKPYTMEFEISANTTTVSGKMSRDGNKVKMKANLGGLDVDAYVIDGKVYMLLPSVKAYTVSDNGNDLKNIGVNDYSLDTRAEYRSTEEKDGYICETYAVPAAKNTPADYKFDEKIDKIVTYCYDKSTKKPVKMIGKSPITGETTIKFTKVEFDIPEIVMPDITGWTEIKEGEKLDPSTQMKLTITSLGITDEMIKKSGYTFDQLVKMTTRESSEALLKIMKDNGLR